METSQNSLTSRSPNFSDGALSASDSIIDLVTIQFFITTPISLLLMAITILCYVLTIKLQKTFEAKPVKKYTLPPGPKPWPVIGCIPEMIKCRPVYKWMHSFMKEIDTQIACFRFGNTHVIPVTCPKIACEFLKKKDALMISRPVSVTTELLTSGYLTTVMVPYEEQWKKMKKVLVKHVLCPTAHKWQQHMRVEEADHLIHYVFNQCKAAGGGLVNVRVASQQYCGNVVRRMIFNKRFFSNGKEDGGPGKEEEEHVYALFIVLEYIYAFCVSDYIRCMRVFDLEGHEKVVRHAIDIIKELHDPIIEERIKLHVSKKAVKDQDLLDVLINLKNDNGSPLLSVQELKAQILEIMMAAVDNPSSAFEWALAEMINHPEILNKAVEELDRVVGKERLVQESDFAQLNYVKACIREAFRLHPIAPFNVPHVSTADTVVANYFIPKGSHILLSRLGLGRNPKIWDEPLKFQPERHLKSDGSEVVLTEHELRFISFSTGRRGCSGINLGSAMSIMLFARLLHGFDWSAAPGESKINAVEADYSLALAKPLVALAKPRLPPHLYFA